MNDLILIMPTTSDSNASGAGSDVLLSLADQWPLPPEVTAIQANQPGEMITVEQPPPGSVLVVARSIEFET